MHVISKSLSENLSLFTILSYCTLFICGGKFPANIFLQSFDFLETGKYFGTIVFIGFLLIIFYGFRKKSLISYAYFHLIGILFLYVRLFPEIKCAYREFGNSFYFWISYILFFILSIFAIYIKFQRAIIYNQHSKI